MVKSKRAIAMVELIFALVIMGIVLMSAPMLIQQSIKSSNVALQQEAIVAASSQTSILLSMYWDEKNTEGESPILDIHHAGAGFTQPGLNGNIFGRTIYNANHTSLFPSTHFGPDFNETDYTRFDDVDDYHNSNLSLELYNAESTSSDIGEYVDTNVSIVTTVEYREDTNISKTVGVGSESNVKFITVNLTNNQDIPELEKNITMQAFSCNIGTYSIHGKELP